MMDLDADVIVIGSGCTGGWACKVLSEAGHSVLLLEAGPALDTTDRPDRWYQDGDRTPAQDASRQPIQSNHQAFCEANRRLWVDDVDNPYVLDPDHPFVWIRARTLGGRSNLWGGQCWRLTPHELDAPLHDGVGEPWPLRYEDLRPHYEEVESFQGVTGQREGHPDLPDQIVSGEVAPTHAESALTEALEHAGWSRPVAVRAASERRDNAQSWPRFSSLGSTLPAASDTGRLRIVSDAVVSRLESDTTGRRVRAAHYIDRLSGEARSARALAFVLCASTVESTRILLHSASPQHPHGLGNSSGVLGRYLMDHVGTVTIGNVAAEPGAAATFFGGRHGLYLPRLRDTDTTPAFLRSYGFWISLGRPMGHGRNAILTAIGEMLPHPDNRVVLEHGHCDRWGLPVPRIECRERDNERAMRLHQRHISLELARLAGVEVAHGPSEVAPGAMVHEVGTARMGGDPCTSFCNSVAQSWDVPNLFVPDGACWTTSAYQNPTLTMMALSARCSHFVAAQLARLKK